MAYLVTELVTQMRLLAVDSAFVQLIAAVLIGATSYAAIIAFLWHLVGRPVGAESIIFGWAKSRLRWNSRPRSP